MENSDLVQMRKTGQRKKMCKENGKKMCSDEKSDEVKTNEKKSEKR